MDKPPAPRPGRPGAGSGQRPGTPVLTNRPLRARGQRLGRCLGAGSGRRRAPAARRPRQPERPRLGP